MQMQIHNGREGRRFLTRGMVIPFCVAMGSVLASRTGIDHGMAEGAYKLFFGFKERLEKIPPVHKLVSDGQEG